MSLFVESTSIPPPFHHQTITTQKILNDKKVFIASDAGTGKTRAVLDAIAHRKATDPDAGNALIIAPKSILSAAWADDARKFTPALAVSIAYASNRASAFGRSADVYITNHDAATWLANHSDVLTRCNIDSIFIDESTAYKHANSNRSKAIKRLIKELDPEYVAAMSATPNINNPLDIWHQVLLIDQGERLGNNFYKFRQAICTPVPIGGTSHFSWEPKDDAHEAITDLIDDITIRYRFQDCIDIPENSEHVIHYDLPPALAKHYENLKQEARLELENGETNAVNAAVLHSKLLQVAAGAVYADNKETMLIDGARYELAVELIQQREKCLVAFQWHHQREQLMAALEDAKLSYDIIDGSVSDKRRQKAVRDFNDGPLRVLLAHPQSAGHGLTLTSGTTTLWPSPISNAELFYQFNRRIYRAGQTQKTETLVIVGRGTIEELTHERCTKRVEDQETTLQLLQRALNES